MRCREARPLIYLLADQELDKNRKAQIREHMLECQICREEYQLAREMKEAIFTQFQPEDYLELGVLPRKARPFFKRPLAALLAMVLLTLALVVPVYGQEALVTFQEWVRQLTITEGGEDYIIRTDLYTHPEVIPEQPDEATPFPGFEQALDELGYQVREPGRAPRGFTQAGVKLYSFQEGETNLLVAQFKHPRVNQGEASLTVTYEFMRWAIHNREITYPQGTLVKEITFHEHKAIFHKLSNEHGAWVGLDILVNQGDFKTLRLFRMVTQEEYRGKLPQIERELLQMAQSILP